MKCPNCGKEALFVNGKYVCVDCGIEITPEQQAAQEAEIEPVAESAQAASSAPESASTIEPVVSEDTAKIEEPAGYDNPTESPEATTEPVRDYFESALNSDAPQIEAVQNSPEPLQGGGVYDFSNDQDVNPASVPAPAPEANSETELTPSAEPVVESDTAPQGNSLSDINTPNYFDPSSFDMNAPQPAAATPETTTVPDFPDGSAASDIAPEKTIESGAMQSELPVSAPAVSTEASVVPAAEELETKETTANSALEIQPVSALDIDRQSVDSVDNEAPSVGQNLDEMLGTTSPASAYTPVMDSISVGPQNANNKEAMPSVESVFGGDQNQQPQNPNMPTAQDFGIAPPPVPVKKNIWPFVVAGIVGFLVLAGAITAIIIGTSKEKTVAPVDLTNEQVVSLSTNVTQAMSSPQGMTVGYEMTAGFIGISVKDKTKAGAAYNDYFAKDYTTSGTWSNDSAGNLEIDTVTRETRDKRTYISKESSTYIYSEGTKKYTQKDGIQLAGIPSVFGAEEKAAIFYTTSIEKATDYYTETIDGVSYHKYQIQPSEEMISNTLESMGPVFDGVTYESLDVTKVLITVWVNGENKIGKVALSGEVSLVTDRFEGKISFTGEAKYMYQEMTITAPGADPSAESAETDAETPETTTKVDTKEEGQTSSVIKDDVPIKETDPAVEARG